MYPALTDIDKLLREAEAIQMTDYWRLEAIADEVIERARQAKLPVQTAQALTYRAWARLHLGDTASCVRNALDALIIAREYRAARVEYLALRALSIVFEHGGLPDEALRLHELQRQIVSTLDEPMLEASVLNNMGAAEHTRDPHKAAKLFIAALALLPNEDSSRSRRIIMSWNAANSLAATGQIESAMGYALDADAAAKAIGARHWGARVAVTIAYLTALQGDFALAHERIEAVRPEMLALEYPQLTGEFHSQLGMILMEEGRGHEAVGALEDAYQVQHDHDLINVQIDTLKSLARCYEEINDMAGVVSTYKRMTEGVVNQQKRGAELRFAVMKAAFDIDKASIEVQAKTNEMRATALHRLSHEFRTPLAVINSSASMVSKYGDRISSEATRARLEEITTQVRWMTVMMDDIAELLQPDAANFPIEPFTLADLAHSVMGDVERYLLDTRRIAVEMIGAGVAWHGTVDALRRSLVQVLTNALKFSQDEVQLELRAEHGVIIATVTDTGVGIPADELALVTQPMYRASNIGEIGGTGLGLALVDKLTKGAGAVFALTSTAGGTTATLHWPVTEERRAS